MRRTIGAILIETRPERISRSAWRGEARKASQPKRAMSRRAPTTDIISIAQQARPKVAGNSELPRAQPTALSSVVVMIRSCTYCSRSSPSRSPRPPLSRLRISMAPLLPFEGAAAPDVDERHHQQNDEDDRLNESERAERP